MSHVDDAHWSVNFEQNGEGWYVPECQCGWKWSPVPDAEDAADALMQHAYEQGVLWQRSLAARSPSRTERGQDD